MRRFIFILKQESIGDFFFFLLFFCIQKGDFIKLFLQNRCDTLPIPFINTMHTYFIAQTNLPISAVKLICILLVVLNSFTVPMQLVLGYQVYREDWWMHRDFGMVAFSCANANRYFF